MHDPFPTPFSNEVLDNIVGNEAYSFTNGFSGYHQVRIAEEDKRETTFMTEWGLYAYNVMPFRLKNAPLVFSKIVIVAFWDYIHKFLEVYMVPFWTLLGHIICRDGVCVDPTKFAAIVHMDLPCNVKQLGATPVHTRYYRRFIRNYASITALMEKFLKKMEEFIWIVDYQVALNKLKEILVITPILVYLDWNKMFHVHIDTSGIALGVVLA
eukprot:PITA_05691